jgi:hypothetical protein
MPIASLDTMSFDTLRQTTVLGLRLIVHRLGVNPMYQVCLLTRIRKVVFIPEYIHSVNLKIAHTDLA